MPAWGWEGHGIQHLLSPGLSLGPVKPPSRCSSPQLRPRLNLPPDDIKRTLAAEGKAADTPSHAPGKMCVCVCVCVCFYLHTFKDDAVFFQCSELCTFLISWEADARRRVRVRTNRNAAEEPSHIDKWHLEMQFFNDAQTRFIVRREVMPFPVDHHETVFSPSTKHILIYTLITRTGTR